LHGVVWNALGLEGVVGLDCNPEELEPVVEEHFVGSLQVFDDVVHWVPHVPRVARDPKHALVVHLQLFKDHVHEGVVVERDPGRLLDEPVVLPREKGARIAD